MISVNTIPSTLQQAADKLLLMEEDIYTETMHSNNISLMQGLGGVPLLYTHLYAATGKKIYKEKNLEVVDKITDLLGSTINSLNYYEGLAGIAALFNYLVKKGYENMGLEEVIDACDDVLFNAFLAAVDDMDFLHGVQGIFTYFLNKDQDTINNEKREAMIAQITAAANSYIARAMDAADTHHIKVNCGMAHGMLAYILIITKYLTIHPSKTAKQTLTKLVDFLLSCATKNAESLAVFPSIIDYSEVKADATYIVPLGWCYGDNIISLVLYKAGVVLKDWSLIKKAKALAIITTKRDNTYSAVVHDACFCHGAASIAHIYQKWYHYTGNIVFKYSYHAWIERTINMCSFDDGIGGYKQFMGENNFKCNLGLLDGACGVALALSDYVYGKRTDWDSFFLLD